MINIQNKDVNECFKWHLEGYLHPADHHPEKIRTFDEDFATELDFEDVKFPAKVGDIK